MKSTTRLGRDMLSDAHLQSPNVATYNGSARGHQYERWREDLWRRIGHFEAEPARGQEIQSRVEFAQFSGIMQATASGSCARFERSARLLSDQCDDFILVAARSGPLEATYKSRSIPLRPLEFVLNDMADRGSASLNDGNVLTATRIPRRQLLSICPRAEDRLGSPLVDNYPVRQAIATYLELSSRTAHLLDASGQQLIAQHIIDMLALLLRTTADHAELANQKGYSAARLKIIQQDIISNYSDPNLTIEAVARRQACHPRQIQRLFATNGSTFTEFVLDQRLQHARRLLSSPVNRSRKVSDIAYDAGFHDLAYFNRTFRVRFGVTPSDCRRELPQT